MFKRNIYVHPFHEEDPIGLVELLGADRVLFGSDYPHPEGMADPISFVDELSSLPHEDVAKIMGGNLNRLMNLETAWQPEAGLSSPRKDSTESPLRSARVTGLRLRSG